MLAGDVESGVEVRSLRRRRWQRWAVGAAALVLLLAAPFVLRAIWKGRLVRAELARIRAAGEPVTPEDFAAQYRLPAGTANATPAWRVAFQTLASDRGARYPDFGLGRAGVTPPAPGEEWKDFKAAQKFVAKYAPLYAQIETAVATPGECEYLSDFSQGFQTTINFVQHLSSIRRLLVLRAWVRAHEGDASGAAADLRAVFTTMETLSREGSLGSQLTRMMGHQAAVKAIEGLLPIVPWDDAELMDLQHILLAVDYQAGMTLSIQGQRVDGLLAFQDASTAGARNVPTLAYRAWTRDDPLTFLETYRELIDASRRAWPAPLSLTADYQAKSPEDLADEGKVPKMIGGSWVVPSKLAGLVRWQIELTACETARLRAAAAGLAAARFRRTEKRWPSSLEELAPRWMESAPLDPYTGKQFLMAVADGDFTVYSVGINGRDDGGVETPEVDQSGSHYRGAPDVAFRVREAREREE